MPRTKNPDTRTRWFAPDRDPDLPGVYEVEDKTYYGKLVWFAYWNGREFKSRGISPQNAYTHKHQPSSYGSRPLRWRGLAHKPATHPAEATRYSRSATRQ